MYQIPRGMKREWLNIESWNPEMMRQFIWLMTTLFVSFWIYKVIVSIIKKQESKVQEQKIIAGTASA